MRQKGTPAKRKSPLAFAIYFIILMCVCCSGLILVKIYPLLLRPAGVGGRPLAAPEVFPNTDIIYSGWRGVGFVNADGSGQQTFRFQVVWHDPRDYGQEIFFMSGDHKTLVTVYTFAGRAPLGYVYIAHPGEFAVNCTWTGIVRLTPDQTHILLETNHGQEQFSFADCGTGNLPKEVSNGDLGTLSPDEQYAVGENMSGVVRDENKYDHLLYNLLLHDLRTGEQRVIKDGRFPVWSRDSQWLAYTGVDGIYVIQNNPDAEPRRVVAMERLSINVPLYADGEYPPIVSWSPDGKWLVYHMLSENPEGVKAVYGGYHYSIFKINMETGETVKLLNNGLYPYWIWPAEKP